MSTLKPWLFPLVVACIYGICSVFAPEGAGRAMQVALSIFSQLWLPLCVAFAMMVAINRFLSPAWVTELLGQQAGIKGVFISSLAGVLSMGPIYAWYPLFKSLREKGASSFHVANFISCRSVKPVLLPVLVAYFGWRYATAYVLVTFVGALIVAYVVGTACPTAPKSEDT